MAIQTQTQEQPSLALAAWLMPVLTIFIWSGNTIVTKASAGLIEPASIAFYRWLIAFLLLSPFVARGLWANRALALTLWPKLFAFGMLGMVVYQSIAYEAAKTTTAINMGLIAALMPLISTLFASVLAAERLSAPRIVGGILSLAGVAYLIARGDPQLLLSGGFHIGDALMLAAVLANSLYGVLIKRWSLPLPMWQQLWWQIAFATLVLLPVWLFSDISPITGENLPLVLYAAIPTSLLAPYCWILSIRTLGAARSSLIINLLPLMVVVLAWAILGERLEGYHFIGGGLALAGVLLAMRQPR